MNNFQKKLQETAEHLRLSNEEKAHMRAALFDAMHKASPTPTVPRPARRSPIASPYLVWARSPRMIAAFSGVMLAVFVASGTAYAAQSSLPGDVLYPIKINITEPIETAVAVTPQAKVAVNEKLAARRVKEAQALYARGTLTASTTAQLEQNFTLHARAALLFAKDIPHPTATPKASDSKSDSKVGAPLHAGLRIQKYPETQDQQKQDLQDHQKQIQNIQTEGTSSTQAIQDAQQQDQDQTQDDQPIRASLEAQSKTLIDLGAKIRLGHKQ